jgi:hypothetical protein
MSVPANPMIIYHQNKAVVKQQIKPMLLRVKGKKKSKRERDLADRF